MISISITTILPIFQFEYQKSLVLQLKPSSIFIQDDLIAYTASGGVVVCTIDIETNEVIAQRFFCANISYTNHSNHNSNNNNNNNGLKKRRSIIGSGTSSANAYLNMIKSYDYSEKN